MVEMQQKLKELIADPDAQIHLSFTKYTPPPKPSRITRLKYFFMRRALYQRYALWRYGKKVEITRIIGLQ